MTIRCRLPVLLVAAMAISTCLDVAFAADPTNLRCEYLINPQGIDVTQPRLSWVIKESNQKALVRGQRQTAYQVLVASTPEQLAEDHGDWWDSGKVASAQSVQVEYAAKPLESRAVCHWKVRVWDEKGTASAWSEPAHWSMGLLKPEDWSGKWISMKQSQWVPHTEELDLDGAQWIWYSGDASDKPIGKRYFRRQFSLPEKIKSAVMALSADDRFTLLLNGKRLKEAADWRNPVTVDLTKTVTAGANILEVQAENNGDFAGLIGRIKIVPEQGASVEIVTDASWESSQKNDPPRWQPAKAIGAHGMAPWGKLTGFGKGQPSKSLNSRNSPMLRKSFTLAKPVRHAQVSICGLGYYELFLNGAKVGDHVLDPAWTSYHKNALYITYDISNALKPGGNALGVQLANGVYNQEFADAWNFQKAPWRAFPQMLLQLDVVYADGTGERIVSDESWKASAGPIYWDQLRMGVMYDARREQPGWSTATFDDSAWEPAILREGVKGRLAAQVCEPIKVMETLKPVKIAKHGDVYEFDFGRNIAGWSRLKVSGNAGTEVVMDHGSHTLVEGKPLQTDVYVLKGQGEEVWEPGFTYHGFRSVKVSGLPKPPGPETLEGRVVNTSFEDRGEFECSNPVLNKIVAMSRRSYVGNFVGIPTDCPHREKNGWSADAQVATELGLAYFGSEAAYTRWMLDYQAIQAEDGKLPCIVPDGGFGWGTRFLDGPAWESAYLVIPWHIYEYRGDRRILEHHYENYKRWLSWYRDQNRVIDKARFEGGGCDFSRYKNPQQVNQENIICYGIGDWPPNGLTPFEITSTAYYYNAARIVSRIAGLLGKREEEQEYADLATNVRTAFNREFYDDATGTYSKGSHTGMSCALYLGLVEDKNRQRVADNLADGLRKHGYTVHIGCLGAKFLLRALADNGHLDVAYQVVAKKSPPGWGFLADSGRTTLAEQLDGGGSDNHVFLGDVAAWMMQYLAGIRHDPAHPGFQRFLVRPQPVGDLQWVKAHHDSPYGRISSEWKKDGDTLALDVCVPPNSTAEVAVPAKSPDGVLETGLPAAQAQGVKFLRMENGAAVYAVGSGVYQFQSPLSASNR